jgi:hypothetical protein
MLVVIIIIALNRLLLALGTELNHEPLPSSTGLLPRGLSPKAPGLKGYVTIGPST